MKTLLKIPRIPKGWRRIYGQAVIRDGGKWWNRMPIGKKVSRCRWKVKAGRWEFAEIGIGTAVSFMRNIYIRKIQRKTKP